MRREAERQHDLAASSQVCTRSVETAKDAPSLGWGRLTSGDGVEPVSDAGSYAEHGTVSGYTSLGVLKRVTAFAMFRNAPLQLCIFRDGPLPLLCQFAEQSVVERNAAIGFTVQVSPHRRDIHSHPGHVACLGNAAVLDIADDVADVVEIIAKVGAVLVLGLL